MPTNQSIEINGKLFKAAPTLICPYQVLFTDEIVAAFDGRKLKTISTRLIQKIQAYEKEFEEKSKTNVHYELGEKIRYSLGLSFGDHSIIAQTEDGQEILKRFEESNRSFITIMFGHEHDSHKRTL